MYADDHDNWLLPDSETVLPGWLWGGLSVAGQKELLTYLSGGKAIFFCPWKKYYEWSANTPKRFGVDAKGPGYAYVACTLFDAWSGGKRAFADFNSSHWIPAVMNFKQGEKKRWDGKIVNLSNNVLLSDFVGGNTTGFPNNMEFLDGNHMRRVPKYKEIGWVNYMPGRNQLMGDGHVDFRQRYDSITCASWIIY